jgi:hypothetical protein
MIFNVAAAIVVLLIAVRAGFFLVTIAAREPIASLRRAGALARRNNIRLLGVLLAILVPVVLITAIALPFSLPALTNADFGQALDIASAHSGRVASILVSAIVAALALLAGASTTAYEAVSHTAAEAEEEAVAEPVRREPYRPQPVSHEIPDVPGLVTASVAEVPAIIGEDVIVPREEPDLAPQLEQEQAAVSADPSLPAQPEAAEAKPDEQPVGPGDAVHPLATLMPVDAIVLDNVGNGAGHAESPTDLRDALHATEEHEAEELTPHVAETMPQPEQMTVSPA